jgi:hypothetical protein
MNKKYFALISFIFLFGCKPLFDNNESVESNKLKWATVDQPQVKQALSRLILNDTPYPEDIYYDKNVMSNKLKALKDGKRQEEMKCALPNDKDTSIDYSRSRYFNKREEMLDLNCLKQKEISESINTFNEQISGQQELINKRNSFDKKIAGMADIASIKAIKDYSKGKFDLILNARRSDVIYNKGGVTLDVTGSVIEFYEHHKTQY